MRNGAVGLPGMAAFVVWCLSALFASLPALAVAQEIDPIVANWERTDRPVMEGAVNRTWIWGPASTAYMTHEPYAESPAGERRVIYFDKSRMEITDPGGDRDSPWFVTNGLLVVEMITGRLQVGHARFEQRAPAQVNVAGDSADPAGVTYAALANLLAPYEGPKPETLTWTVDQFGRVGIDSRFATYGAGVGVYAPETGHWVAQPFWDFMHASGVVWRDNGLVTEPLFASPYYATGYPITEAYWARVLLLGVPTDVLLQCFERRCLTWTPGNPAGWEVETGNVGRHYYIWRYGEEPPTPVG